MSWKKPFRAQIFCHVLPNSSDSHRARSQNKMYI